MRALIHLSLFFFMLLPLTLNAKDYLKEADSLYKKRGQSLDIVHKAKAIYLKVIKSDYDIAGKRHALDRFARLTILEGELGESIFNVRAKKRGDMFAKCMEAAEYLSPHTVGEDLPEYYYWKANCMSLRAIYSNSYVLENMFVFTTDLMHLIELGKAKFPVYDGGGFYRLQAVINVKSEKVQISGFYYPEIALENIETAIATNSEYYIAFLFKAEILHALKRRSEAVRLLQAKIPEFEERMKSSNWTIPNGIENVAILKLMKSTLRKISS